MIKSGTHVYCVHCKHFRLDDEDIPYCPYEEKECDITDFEDSRPFSERPYYEAKEPSDEIMAILDEIQNDK